jgi:hypothetical protein
MTFSLAARREDSVPPAAPTPTQTSKSCVDIHRLKELGG